MSRPLIIAVPTKYIEDQVILISNQDYQNAMNMSKAEAYKMIQLGWVQFTNEELHSAGIEGICEAATRFDPNKGTVKDTKFTSWAYFYIKKYIQAYIAKNKSMVSGSMSDCYSGKVGYTMSINAMDDNPDSGGSDHILSLADNSPSIEDELSKPIVKQDLRDLLATLFMKLNPNERLVIQLSYGIGTIDQRAMSIREISESMECSNGKIHGLLRSAEAKLKELKETYQVTFNCILEMG